jgi:hypothetical protein
LFKQAAGAVFAQQRYDLASADGKARDVVSEQTAESFDDPRASRKGCASSWLISQPMIGWPQAVNTFGYQM